MKRRGRVINRRDSVCAADDCDAPHEKKSHWAEGANLIEILQRVKRDYLPTNIQGGKATWVVKFRGVKLAVIAQQLPEPKYLVGPDEPIEKCLNEHGDIELYSECYGQEDPDIVYVRIKEEKLV